MKLSNRVKNLESSTALASLCRVVYKAGKGPEGEALLPFDKAVQEARVGRVKRIEFPLSFNEQQAEKAASKNILDQLSDAIEGIRRDTGAPDAGRLILCTKPIVYAKQTLPKHGIGGYFVTQDGETFHQTQWREVMASRGAGFIIVQEYDESREPWHKERSKRP